MQKRQIRIKTEIKSTFCPSCLLTFDQQKHRPRIICQQSHILCQLCYQQLKSSVCPTCKKAIIANQSSINSQVFSQFSSSQLSETDSKVQSHNPSIQGSSLELESISLEVVPNYFKTKKKEISEKDKRDLTEGSVLSNNTTMFGQRNVERDLNQAESTLASQQGKGKQKIKIEMTRNRIAYYITVLVSGFLAGIINIAISSSESQTEEPPLLKYGLLSFGVIQFLIAMVSLLFLALFHYKKIKPTTLYSSELLISTVIQMAIFPLAAGFVSFFLWFNFTSVSSNLKYYPIVYIVFLFVKEIWLCCFYKGRPFDLKT